ncbi:MAG: Benzoyl-CoA reductase/2-hydroxyglutaryl-CoA dehydratase subunit, BcrC/BadD/HgdB [Ignavibacteria bacterium]|nr:Benzoyl-CoA reductase/2-hydroxyglutaryl-CoA dehydratase subunit, BcrC/BadD/HgdB [Ignavibacteria bacterium]
MHKIESSKKLKEIMSDYFVGMGVPGKKFAWCTSVGPAELLRSFGFEVYFPENHGALLGTTRTCHDFIPVAAEIGYSSDICSYLTSDIGSYISKNTPLMKHYGLEGVPKPDILVYNTNQCREVQDWFTYFAREFNCPIVGIQSPRYLDLVKKEDIENVTSQFKALIPYCEETSGTKFDIDSFRETLKLSREATNLWKKSLETAKHIPAPISFFDSTIHMGPIVVLRGTQVAKDYYAELSNELDGYVARGSGIIEKEQIRVYWEGMPIWGKLRYMSDLFSNNNAAVVASTYCNSWVFDAFDETNPFESSALAYSSIFINRSENVKTEMMIKLIEEYKIDGVVFHDSKTCFNNTNSRFGMPQRLKESTSVDTLIIEGDLCDLRFFSEAQTTTKIETFIEQMK